MLDRFDRLYSIEAEQSVIGALLHDNSAYWIICDKLDKMDFYDDMHKSIYSTISQMIESSVPADVITVTEENEKIDLAYVGTIAKNCIGAANIERYAEIVSQKAAIRRFHDAGLQITEASMESDDAEEMAHNAYSAIEHAANTKHVTKEDTITDILKDRVEALEKRFESGGGLVGISTGFADIDEATLGLKPADLIIVAARPSMGKTSFAMNIAENVAASGGSVMVFSLEMSKTDLVDRSICSYGKVDSTRFRSGKLEDRDWPRVTSSVGAITGWKLHIDDTPSMTHQKMLVRAREKLRTHGLDLVVVDYLQLMSAEGNNRNEQISTISRGLKMMARELNVPVIVLSQLNRELERRPNKRPVLADLRDSGAIEQDADVVMFIYRDEIYNEESPDKGTAEIDISKQRAGPIGTRRLVFKGEYYRFFDMHRGY